MLTPQLIIACIVLFVIVAEGLFAVEILMAGFYLPVKKELPKASRKAMYLITLLTVIAICAVLWNDYSIQQAKDLSNLYGYL